MSGVFFTRRSRHTRFDCDWSSDVCYSDLDYRNGIGTQARFDEPQDVAVDSLGNVYVADTFNHVIRIIEPSGLVSTFEIGRASCREREMISVGAAYIKEK